MKGGFNVDAFTFLPFSLALKILLSVLDLHTMSIFYTTDGQHFQAMKAVNPANSG